MRHRLPHRVWGVMLALLAPPCLAQGRPLLPALACGEAAALLAARGAAVLNTGPATYDRFVRDGGFCNIEETTEPAWVSTRDTPQCFIGYRCKSRSNEIQGNRD